MNENTDSSLKIEIFFLNGLNHSLRGATWMTDRLKNKLRSENGNRSLT